MVIGGSNGSTLSDVELVSFGNENKGCKPRDLDYGVYNHASVASSKGVLTCGGVGNGNYGGVRTEKALSKCILQTSNGKTFFPSLVNRRGGLGLVNVEGTIYALGGSPSYDTMETINLETGSEWKIESLPFNMSSFCVVNINTTIIVTGGAIYWPSYHVS